jgi:hypothetical protein
VRVEKQSAERSLLAEAAELLGTAPPKPGARQGAAPLSEEQQLIQLRRHIAGMEH